MNDAPAVNILILDDDKFLLDMYVMKFTQQGYNVHAALSANDAIEILKQGFPADVVVFDLIMPDCDGFQFLERIRAEKLAEKALKVALTNQSTDAEKERAHQLGADHFIVKATMIPSEVVNMIDTVLKAGKAS